MNSIENVTESLKKLLFSVKFIELSINYQLFTENIIHNKNQCKNTKKNPTGKPKVKIFYKKIIYYSYIIIILLNTIINRVCHFITKNAKSVALPLEGYLLN